MKLNAQKQFKRESEFFNQHYTWQQSFVWGCQIKSVAPFWKHESIPRKISNSTINMLLKKQICLYMSKYVKIWLYDFSNNNFPMILILFLTFFIKIINLKNFMHLSIFLNPKSTYKQRYLSGVARIVSFYASC